MIPEEFSRAALLIGEDAIQTLRHARVAVVGIGGVGSYAVEALARAGVGHLLLIDDDTVSRSNINRQLHATQQTIGQYKTRLMEQRVRCIYPETVVDTAEVFCLPGNIPAVLTGSLDYVIDAIDTVSAKLAIVEHCHTNHIPVISAMGTGNKLDPSRFIVADLFDTSVCPLCRVMRHELRKRSIDALKVVYSDEPPQSPLTDSSADDVHPKRQTPGSLSFVPPVAGMLLAGAVVRDLLHL